MTGAAQQRGGARLNLPRDIQTVYCIARMGAVTTQTIGNLFFGSPHTARHGMARLMKLHLVRTFARAAPSFFRAGMPRLPPESAGWSRKQTVRSVSFERSALCAA